MVYIIRCNDVVSDPRAMKYVSYLKETHQDYKLIGWDREGKYPKEDNAIYFHKPAGYNVGGIRAVRGRIKWMWFVYKTLKSSNAGESTLHACDLDCAFPAAVYKLFNRGKVNNLIFDVFDWYSATLYNQNKLILSAFRVMEKFTTKRSDYLIICEPERVAQIPYHVNPSSLKVLPNIPGFSDKSFIVDDDSYRFPNNLLTVSYVGGFFNERCLDELLTIAQSGTINLSIAGYGSPAIEVKAEQLGKLPNVKYYGKVRYEEGLKIMYNSDIIYAMYAKTNPNHIYAAPNKYYESMFLGKPLFTTKGTIVGDKCLKNEIGYVSEEDFDSIEKEFISLDRQELVKKGMNASQLWSRKFSSYVNVFMHSEYQRMISI